MKIRIVKASSPNYWYANKIGEVFNSRYITEDFGLPQHRVGSGFLVDVTDCEEVIEHNSQLYRKVNRKADIGDLIVVVEDFGYGKIGEIHTVKDDDHILCGITTDKAPLMNHSRYLVLEPIESTPTLTETDLIANLAQEVAKEKKLRLEIVAGLSDLEDELSDLKRELTNVKDDVTDLEERIDENEKDVEELEQNLTVVIEHKSDLGDGAEAEEKSIADRVRETGVLETLSVYSLHKLRRELEEALRNG